ncbi:hypothetical protein Tco_0274509 [Tanacetum coccineum]
MYDDSTPYVPAFNPLSTNNLNLVLDPISTEPKNITPTFESPDSPIVDDHLIMNQPDEPDPTKILDNQQVPDQFTLKMKSSLILELSLMLYNHYH